HFRQRSTEVHRVQALDYNTQRGRNIAALFRTDGQVNGFELGGVGRLCGLVNDLLQVKKSLMRVARSECPFLHFSIHRTSLLWSLFWGRKVYLCEVQGGRSKFRPKGTARSGVNPSAILARSSVNVCD